MGLLEWWEHKQCQHSQFMGLGYGVTVPQYVARHALTGRPKPRLSGELRAARRARREAQLEEGETYYLGFEAFGMDEACDGTKMAAFLGDAAVDDSVVLPKDMYEDVYSVIDSGTTLSVTRLKSLLQRFDPTQGVSIKGFNGTITRSEGRGVAVGLARSRRGSKVVLHVPHVHRISGAPVELLSVSSLLKEGYEFHFTPRGSWIVTPDMEALDLVERGGLFWLEWRRVNPSDMRPEMSHAKMESVTERRRKLERELYVDGEEI